MLNRIVLMVAVAAAGAGWSLKQAEAQLLPGVILATSTNYSGGDDLLPAGPDEILPTFIQISPGVDVFPSAPGLQQTGTLFLGSTVGSVDGAEYVYCSIFDSYAIWGSVPFNPSLGTAGGMVTFSGSVWGNNIYLWVVITGAPPQPRILSMTIPTRTFWS